MSSETLQPSDPSLNATRVALPHQSRPLLFVVVDTEEEFDWSAPFARENTSVRAIAALEPFQRRLERIGLEPTYVIDYPVANHHESSALIKTLAATGRCAVGAHLHPWVTPPFVEDVNRVNSFACNLGEDVEAAKLAVLTERIEERIGLRPRIYKAGRYGFGTSTARILEKQGYEIDVSINPLMNNQHERGPNFEAFDAQPFFFGSDRRLLEVPCTQGFAGFARGLGLRLHNLAQIHALRHLRLPGVMRRSGALDKIMLSPETSTFDEMQALSRALFADGVRTFTMTLHSPSLEPGHTPYVRSAADLQAFIDRMERFFAFFFESLAGVPATLDQFHQAVARGGATA